MRSRSTAVITLVVAACMVAVFRAPVKQQPRKPKVHISVDMEGVVGTVTSDQLGPAGFEYSRYREFMTREALENYMPVEVLGYLPLFERVDSHSIRFRAKDMAEASAIMEFIGEYRADITP